MGRPPTLAVRADGGTDVGAGHLVRCLALVQAWRDRGGQAVLASIDPPPAWARRYVAEGCDVVAARDLPDADWVVVDGYGLDAPADAGRVLRIDDHARAPGGGNLVLDQNLGANAGAYGGRACLLGPRYALIRRELVTAARSARGSRSGVVVAPGGYPSPETRRFVVSVLAELGAVPTVVLDGTDDVTAPFSTARAAFATAGSTCWELCLFGLPSVLVAAAPNQEPLASGLGGLGAAEDAGRVGDADPVAVARALCRLLADDGAWAAMAGRAGAVVDGRGAPRVVTRMRAELLTLRPVTASDAEVLHEWSQDGATRAASFSSADITWDEHVAWLDRRLGDPSAVQLVASAPDGGLVGLVRFDLAGDGDAEIAVNVAPGRRRQGWGAALVDAGCRHVAASRGVRSVLARIKPANDASQRAFLDADFDADGGSGDDGASVLRYLRRTDDDAAG